MQSAKKSRNTIMMDFYLPCAVSGLLLAGLIAITNPAPPVELSSDSAVMAMHVESR